MFSLKSFDLLVDLFFSLSLYFFLDYHSFRFLILPHRDLDLEQTIQHWLHPNFSQFNYFIDFIRLSYCYCYSLCQTLPILRYRRGSPFLVLRPGWSHPPLKHAPPTPSFQWSQVCRQIGLGPLVALEDPHPALLFKYVYRPRNQPHFERDKLSYRLNLSYFHSG